MDRKVWTRPASARIYPLVWYHFAPLTPPASRSPEEQALRGTDVLYMEWRPLLDTSLIPPRDFCLLRSWHKFSRSFFRAEEDGSRIAYDAWRES